MKSKCMSCGGSMKKYQAGGTKKVEKNLPPTPGPYAPSGEKGMGYKKEGNKNTLANKLKAKSVTAPKKVYPSKPEPGSTYQPKMKKGGFPDLTGDGKVTRADILKGRGVIKKTGGSVKKKK
jgi:hypothetical protein